MKNLLIILLFTPLISFGQYSNYYGRVDANVNVNKTVNSYVNKTVTTIDYGALRLANAQREKNRLESLQYSDNRKKNQAIEIALNPKKAFDYGLPQRQVFDKSIAMSYGFKKGATLSWVQPNESLFSLTSVKNSIIVYRNESEEGVVTELEIEVPVYYFGSKVFLKKPKKERKQYYISMQPYIGKTEKYVKNLFKNIIVGEKSEEGKFTHKIDINKARVWGNEGFSWSWFYEDDYEYVIKDNFHYISPEGVQFRAGVRYRGDKDEVTFEILEGRRSYLKRLCAEIIATARLQLGKRGLNK